MAATTFHGFSNLPSELRTRVWQLTDQSREIPIREIKLEPHVSRFIFAKPHAFPQLLAVCREAREVGLKRYEYTNFQNRLPRPIYYNPQRDYFFFNNSPNSDFSGFTGPMNVNNDMIHRVAIQSSLREDLIWSLKKGIECCANLREIDLEITQDQFTIPASQLEDLREIIDRHLRSGLHRARPQEQADLGIAEYIATITMPNIHIHLK